MIAPLISDHFDGTRFRNPPLPEDWKPAPRPPGWPDSFAPPDAAPRRNRRGIRPLTMLRWMVAMARRKPVRLPSPPPSGDPHALPGSREISITFIGHDTFLLRIPQPDGTVLTAITDPIFSRRCSPFSFFGPVRMRPPGRALAELPPIDLVLISHSHYDHLDLPSLRAIARRDNPVTVTPWGNGAVLRKAGLRRIVELDWMESVRMGATEITCTPARHFSQRTPFDASRRLWGGFMIRTAGRDGDAPLSVFFAGDTAHGPHWQQIRDITGSPDIALLPIGAYAPRAFLKNQHIDPVEAVAAFRILGARYGIGMHYDTFPLSREPPGEAERCLKETVAWAGLAPGRFSCMDFGETRLFRV